MKYTHITVDDPPPRAVSRPYDFVLVPFSVYTYRYMGCGGDENFEFKKKKLAYKQKSFCHPESTAKLKH